MKIIKHLHKITVFLLLFSFHIGISQFNKAKIKDSIFNKKIVLHTLDTLTIINSFYNNSNLNKNSYFFILNSKSVFKKDLQQIYIHYDEQRREVFEILTKNGPKYYNFNLEEIASFKEFDVLNCGNIYSENFSLHKKDSLKIVSGDFGGFQKKILLKLKELPKNTKKIRFLNNQLYTSKSINYDYNTFPNLLKIITTDTKTGIYSYNKDEALFPKKKKRIKKEYYINEKGEQVEIPPIIPVVSLTKKGFVKVKEVLPPIFDSIQQSSFDRKVYLFKDHKIGIFPHHKNVEYTKIQKYSKSFYKVFRGKNEKWLDIRRFIEY